MMWQDGDFKSPSTFHQKIFEAYGVADGTNMAKLKATFPELFVINAVPLPL